MELTRAEITRLAVDRYTDEGYEGIGDCLFALLVDVADATPTSSTSRTGLAPMTPRRCCHTDGGQGGAVCECPLGDPPAGHQRWGFADRVMPARRAPPVPAAPARENAR
ncbi:MAG: hypothetical protein M3Z75_23060 [Actinomycetota bacterium]|nr:hypothetical protein [Actinomycetota bacterium]